MLTVLKKHRYLLLKLNLFEQTALKSNLRDVEAEFTKLKINLENLKNNAEQLVDDGTDKEEIKKKFEHQYTIIAKKLENLEALILESDIAVEAMYAELPIQIHRAIEENSLDGVAALLEVGRTLFEEGADINAKNVTYNTPLSHAIVKGQLEIATFLLESRACANSFHYKHKPPLYIAIQEKKAEFVSLLLKYGAKIDSYRIRLISPLYHAIELGDRTIVEILVSNGAKVNAERGGVIVGPTLCFNSPLRHALECKQRNIARFLFDVIKKDPKLFQDSLYIFINYAPLELLQYFVQDASISIQSKLATSVITRINSDKSVVTRSSGEILLRSLLENSDHEKERLAILKQVIKQLMTIDHLESTVKQESCYADIELFEKLAIEAGEYPTKYLAQQLLKSIQDASQQGRVGVGQRLLSEVLSLALNKAFAFSSGIQLIEEVTGEFSEFYKKNKGWPDETTVNNLIEKASEKVELSLCPSVRTTPSPAAKRFRAMAGSSIFNALNPGIPAGGTPSEAGQWYREIVSIIVNTMAEEGMLSDDWNEAKALCLLTEICEELSPSQVLSRINSAAQESTKALGFQLDIPEHFIPSCLFEEQNNWVYTVMCRTFIKTASEQEKGAVDFIIPKKSIAELHVPLIKEVLKKRGVDQESSDSAIEREIQYRLLTHFLTVEQLTGTRCTYSTRPSQKPYKGPTCFASNIKLILPVMLSILTNPTTNPKQWMKFNDRLKECIIIEMNKAKMSLEDSKQTCEMLAEKTMAPEYVAYKLVTTLIRWLEINDFNPTNEAEIAGKEATIKHVLEPTENRFKLSMAFFRSTSERSALGREGEHFAPLYN